MTRMLLLTMMSTSIIEDSPKTAVFYVTTNLRKNNSTTKKSNNKMAASSLPVNILRQHGATVFHCGGETDEYDNGGMVPPHVILARRIAGKMAFSVCTSNGRTLKRRDLSQVQNSVLRMTGFLEV
ncbi:uncharacterized protein LOC108484835 [Gossypium arboreum]|uniref:Uncharacterized protein n=1 Tax=Gossypium arboreum TaxID=29729 RepID=A0ABR0PNK0_GOSAR|nr:uncharacterized protein LOC108484835 [Gossypium arboreum]KAK5826006.1 hypothetical protein PVK06_020909 [Gossypium arboreum]